VPTGYSLGPYCYWSKERATAAAKAFEPVLDWSQLTLNRANGKAECKADIPRRTVLQLERIGREYCDGIEEL